MGHAGENCDFFRNEPVDHPDAHPGAAGPHMIGEFNVQINGRFVMFNGHRFEIGRASGAGCNCLIDTLMQKLLLVANVPAVRKRLREQFPRGE